jgi:ethanolamine utilization protein EutS
MQLPRPESAGLHRTLRPVDTHRQPAHDEVDGHGATTAAHAGERGGMSEKQRIIQEFVPGKQVTLAHVVANPDARLYPKIGLPPGGGAIGVMTITPSEASIIAADVATKAAAVELGFVDRFSGSLVVIGRLTDVQTAVESVVSTLCDELGFARPPLTHT